MVHHKAWRVSKAKRKLNNMGAPERGKPFYAVVFWESSPASYLVPELILKDGKRRRRLNGRKGDEGGQKLVL